MSLFITSLNSGSNGNCYYIGNEREAILIDAGISCRETEKRIKSLGLSMKKIRAVFISHEHSDHINGLPVISKKYALPVYITPGTLQNSGLDLDEALLRPLRADEPVAIGGLVVTSFVKKHDAAEPHSFTVSTEHTRVGVFTDIGEPCEALIRHFQECHAAFLEANYDEKMLFEGRYPVHLKKRISGSQGHLSNSQALALFKAYKPPFMTHLFLSHLSQENNRPDLVHALFAPHAGDVSIIIASRFEATEVYAIRGRPGDHSKKLPPAPTPLIRSSRPIQTTLF